MRGRVSSAFALALAVLIWTELVGAQTQRAIAVLDLKSRGLDSSVAENITDMVVKEVDRIGLFRIISMDEIRRMLEHEHDKRLLGCDDVTCLSEIGGALGVDLLMAGGVGKLGEIFIVNLKLIDVKRVRVISREERTVAGRVEYLMTISREASRALLRPIMEQESGMLEMTCNEEGAEVYLDDVVVGNTPLRALKTAGGYHSVRVNKKRFISYSKDVKVEPDKTVRLEVNLIPSKEFIEEYESAAGTYRALAWTFTAVTVAAAGTATGLFVWNTGRIDSYNQDRKEWEENPDLHDPADLNERAGSIVTMDTVTLGVALGAVACAGVSLYFWLAGDPPGRYDHVGMKQPESALRLESQLGPTSVGATLKYRF
jgi:hypothetical protein